MSWNCMRNDLGPSCMTTIKAAIPEDVAASDHAAVPSGVPDREAEASGPLPPSNGSSVENGPPAELEAPTQRPAGIPEARGDHPPAEQAALPPLAPPRVEKGHPPSTEVELK